MRRARRPIRRLRGGLLRRRARRLQRHAGASLDALVRADAGEANGSDDRFFLAPGVYFSSSLHHDSAERVRIIGAGAGKDLRDRASGPASVVGIAVGSDDGAPVTVDAERVTIVGSTPAATDRDGKPRALDGNGDCRSIDDIGAFEYQGTKVRALARAAGATATTGRAVGFSAAGSCIPGAGAPSIRWRFDDGAAATGTTVAQAFAAPGRLTAIATDAAGIRSEPVRTRFTAVAPRAEAAQPQNDEGRPARAALRCVCLSEGSLASPGGAT